MRALDLFSAAAGGWTLGLHRAGFITVAACEIVEWRRILYAENNPHVLLYEDVRSLTAARLLSDLGMLPDIIVGSPPCQDISVANTKGRGIDGERSGLYLEAVRLVGDCRPRWFAFENSAHLRTRGADRVLAVLEAFGYACEPCVVGADNVGANHIRKRSWLIGFDLGQFARSRWDANQEDWQTIAGIRQWAKPDDDQGAPSGSAANADGDTAQVGRGPRRPRRCAESAPESCESPRRDDANADETERRPCFHAGSDRDRQAGERIEGADRHAQPVAPRGGDAADADRGRQRLQSGRRRGARRTKALFDRAHDPLLDERRPGDVADADEARQAHGHLEPGLRPPEIADDGRGDERRNEGADADRNRQPDRAVDAEMGGREGAGGAAPEPWSDWNGGLAHHLSMDDGLSAWVAGTRVAIGDGKRPSAASLIVEAFGDAVLPQIPEAIGRAILRTERALDAVLGPGRSPHSIEGNEP